MSHSINFFSEKIVYTVRNKGVLRHWIARTIDQEGKVGGDINFIFCDDEYLSELNYKYLKHKTLTDILTFPVEDESGHLCGDIFISVPRIRENAVTYQQRTEVELHRVMIHGVLHLIGYADSSKQEKAQMRQKEDFYLENLRKNE